MSLQYWSMYTLEVFTATIWGGIIRCREAQSAVSYPAELDDEMIANDPTDVTMIVPRPNSRLCFLKGWNYTTDLYRILEHAVDRFRRRRNLGNSPVGTLLDMSATSSSPQTILELVKVMHSKLPPRLLSINHIGTNLFEDHFNFQTANITATTQLLRMVLVGGELEAASAEKRCQVAGELLNGLSTIPQEYLRALSSPLVCLPTPIVFPKAKLTPDSYSNLQALVIYWVQSWKDCPNLRSGQSDIYCECIFPRSPRQLY